MVGTIKKFWRILAASWKTFGFGLVFLRWLLLPLYWGFTKLTMALDQVIFPAYKRIPVKAPIFIVGHPRSGTTFFHELLTELTDAATFKGWHLFFPSLLARHMFKPVYRIQRRRRQVLMPADLGHEISLDKVEEEEFLFLHNLDTQFLLTRTPLAFDEREYPELRFHDGQPSATRLKSARFFKGCLQRQIQYTGCKHIVAQIHFSTQRIRTLLKVFPDARFVYLVRSPLETIPSHLSLVYKSLDHQWGIENIPPDRLARCLERRYRYNVELYEYFHVLMQEGALPRENVMVLNYDYLRTHLKEAMAEVLEFTGLERSEEVEARIELKASAQSAYRRSHEVMPLETFGLTRDRVVRDLDFVFDTYGFQVPADAVVDDVISRQTGSRNVVAVARSEKKPVMAERTPVLSGPHHVSVHG